MTVLGFCIVVGAFSIYFYRQYARIIDGKLKHEVFQNSARIYGPSSVPVTNLFGASRVKRRIVEFKDIPKVVIDAVTAGEDQSFFSHHGLAPVRIVGAFVSNLEEGHRLQGGSTITQQLARNLFLTAAPAWRRKGAEAIIALILEMRLTKEQIFAMYANEVYLGQRGSFAIHGFGEGATALFGKDLSELTLPEAATLAGIIPAPNAYSPSRHPDRATARRNLILKAMVHTGAITAANYETASQAQLVPVTSTADATEAPYLIDFIRSSLLKDYSEAELMTGGFRVYTTLDPGLQKAAVEAVTRGLVFVEAQLAARRKKGNPDSRARPQAGLIALDPRTGAITAANYETASQARLVPVASTADATEAPYLIDFIRASLLKDYSEAELMTGGFRVYTTLDPGLQKAAVEAVTRGLVFVEAQLAARKKKNPDSRARPQAGLIALDPRTGAIKAMVGGTDYAASQYNRITHALRQPGSVFKPFVYAAALETPFDVEAQERTSDSGASVESPDGRFITALSKFLDAPGVFSDGAAAPYAPGNYKQHYRGLVSVRTALEHSLNLATIRIAERIGFGRVAALARRMGLNKEIKGYPSVAVGAFEVTPIELAGAYTAFANEGKRMEPHALLKVASAEGIDLKTYKYQPRQVLRPEIAYLMTHLMEGVINHGTGAGVRTRGFKLPAAGKTGTSRDGWFAGYTRDLLVIAWVGFDDNRDLGLEGARSALPMWTEFMLKAYELHPVVDKARMSFAPPPGIEIVRIDADALVLATPLCQNTFEEAFIAGTGPAANCSPNPVQITERF